MTLSKLERWVQNLTLPLAVAVSGCAPGGLSLERSGKVLVEDNFSEIEAIYIDNSLAHWKGATDSEAANNVNFEFGYHADRPFDPETSWNSPEGYVMIRKVQSSEPGYGALGLGYIAGTTDRSKGIVVAEDVINGYVDDYLEQYPEEALLHGQENADIYKRFFQRTILHEMGRFLGANEDIINERSIMYPTVESLDKYRHGSLTLCVDKIALENYCAEIPCGPESGSTCLE